MKTETDELREVSQTLSAMLHQQGMFEPANDVAHALLIQAGCYQHAVYLGIMYSRGIGSLDRLKARIKEMHDASSTITDECGMDTAGDGFPSESIEVNRVLFLLGWVIVLIGSICLMGTCIE